MFRPRYSGDREDALGQGSVENGACSSRLWKDWEGLGRAVKHGFAMMDVTSVVAAAQSGGGVRVRVEGSASVSPGSQVVNCAGWYSTFLLAAPNPGDTQEEVPTTVSPHFPAAFGDSDGAAFFRFPTTVLSSPYRVVHYERTSVSSGDARYWAFDCEVGSVQEDLQAQRWVACVVFCMQQTMSASLGLSVQAQRSGTWE
jgi:hypothetical protein